MNRFIIFIFMTMLAVVSQAQNRMTPELLWQLGRVNGLNISPDGKHVVYAVSTPNISENRSSTKRYMIPLSGGAAAELTHASLITDKNISPDGKYLISVQDVKIHNVEGKDFYPELDKSNVQIYDGLNYRHWDTWEDGAYSHLFVSSVNAGAAPIDLMPNEPYDCPLKPSGGEEDYTWSPDSKYIVYSSKKKSGTAYAISTNTDLYQYELATGKTINLTEGMMGYDTEPAFSSTGTLAWLSMKRDGYEADKNDIVVRTGNVTLNLTQQWDGHVNHFRWSADGKKIYFVAPVGGTTQLFEVDYPGLTKKMPVVKQITSGDFDVSGMVGQAGNTMVVSRTDMNHAAELYTVNLTNGQMTQLTHVNDVVYSKLAMSNVEKRIMTTVDNKKMVVWVIYPPGFDPAKRYPTLLFCAGGPQVPLTQGYSFRWNFQLMAANDYIVVAPNRRGMQGHGVAWNEEISKEHGGLVMQDYLTAIDELSKEPFVDKSRLGCVGASYGGYSVFYLAGHHNNRFKTFISHDGIYNMKSMYGTTEEIFFSQWEYGGAYWEKNNAVAQKTYTQYDPSNFVEKWNTPILIFQGGRDYRVPDGQSFEAFQAAQLRGIKSRLVYLPTENHWVLSAQNAQVWQREFFKWLKETL